MPDMTVLLTERLEERNLVAAPSSLAPCVPAVRRLLLLAEHEQCIIIANDF